jgi:thiol-disulfide isomerase/thioredoxin
MVKNVPLAFALILGFCLMSVGAGRSTPSGKSRESVLALKQQYYPASEYVFDVTQYCIESGAGVLAGVEKFLDNSEGKQRIVLIGATWCIPCKEAYSRLVEYSKTAGDAKAALVIVDEQLIEGAELELRRRYNASRKAGYPAYVVFDTSGRARSERYLHSLEAAQEAIHRASEREAPSPEEYDTLMRKYESVVLKPARQIGDFGDLLQAIHEQTGIVFAAEQEIFAEKLTIDTHNMAIPVLLDVMLDAFDARALVVKSGKKAYVVLLRKQ